MTISELARRTGVAASAIRWYEMVGVLPSPTRSPAGYRSYADADVARVRLVAGLRRLGVAPLDAGRVAHLCLDGGVIDPSLVPLLAAQRLEIARRQDELDGLAAELADLESTVEAAARAAGREPGVNDAPIRVLFVCTGNSARSQIAEALLTTMGGTRFEVASAGTAPVGVNPYAIRVLAARGIDWSGAASKTVDRYLGRPWDYVITVCDRARQACPNFPGDYNRLHWGLDDPAAVEGTDTERVAAFERTATELTMRLRPFIEVALLGADHGSGSAR